MIRRTLMTVGLLAVVSGCEVFKGITPGIGFGAGNTLGASVAAFALGLLGIPVQV